jgi:hypothetical protein
VQILHKNCIFRILTMCFSSLADSCGLMTDDLYFLIANGYRLLTSYTNLISCPIFSPDQPV